MSNISEVVYKELDPETCSVIEASEYHYYNNLLGIHEMFNEEYEEYELRQKALRNQAIREATKDFPSDKPLKMETMIFGVSSLRDRVIVLMDV